MSLGWTRKSKKIGEESLRLSICSELAPKRHSKVFAKRGSKSQQAAGRWPQRLRGQRCFAVSRALVPALPQATPIRSHQQELCQGRLRQNLCMVSAYIPGALDMHGRAATSSEQTPGSWPGSSKSGHDIGSRQKSTPPPAGLGLRFHVSHRKCGKARGASSWRGLLHGVRPHLAAAWWAMRHTQRIGRRWQRKENCANCFGKHCLQVNFQVLAFASCPADRHLAARHQPCLVGPDANR